jgi:hypothetical protein
MRAQEFLPRGIVGQFCELGDQLRWKSGGGLYRHLEFMISPPSGVRKGVSVDVLSLETKRPGILRLPPEEFLNVLERVAIERGRAEFYRATRIGQGSQGFADFGSRRLEYRRHFCLCDRQERAHDAGIKLSP